MTSCSVRLLPHDSNPSALLAWRRDEVVLDKGDIALVLGIVKLKPVS